MEIKFTKMHGIGNDYAYVNMFNEQFDEALFSDIAVKMSARHFSVGADGVIFVCPSTVADVKMRMFNADGSEGKMCGNGVRCVAKFALDYNLAYGHEVTIETLSGIKKVTVLKSGEVFEASVQMGQANILPQSLPANTTENPIHLTVLDRDFDFRLVSMGNPHAVTFVDDLKFDIEKYGVLVEHNQIFPEATNVEFVIFEEFGKLRMRVWERGSGETYACGTGACATAVAAILNGYGKFNEEITVHLLGGVLSITVDEKYNVTMRGEAKTVYEGVYFYEN